MGVGFAKVCMPIVAASLIVWFGWRQTWMVFGLVTLILGVVPAVLFIRRSPEEMGLLPDGAEEPIVSDYTRVRQNRAAADAATNQDLEWTRGEAMRNGTFWLLVITFGIASVGVTGLNLHVYPYVTDLGHPPVVAATVMSVIASMQLFSPLAWGLLAERMDVRVAATLRFVIQAIGLGLATLTGNLFVSTPGFFSTASVSVATWFCRKSCGRIISGGALSVESAGWAC
jgi:OFA family oxalate/formate antiporter-like MFS transporter